MIISVIGCNGFLSTAIASFFKNLGWTLYVYGLEPPTSHPYDQFFQINLMSQDIDCNILQDSTLVIYAAGAGIQSNLRDDNTLIYKLNVEVPVLICNKLKKLGFVGRFVTFGSYFEIGEVDGMKAFTEEDILTTSSYAPNDYVISKRMLSCFASSYKHQFTHWHFYLPTIYGERENPIRLIPYTINAIKEDVALHYTSGEQTRQYIYVNEIPEMLKLAIDKELPSGIYNVEGKETMTVREIVSLIHKKMNKKLADGCFGSAQRDDVGMRYLVLDGSKLKRAIGFEPKVVIEDVILKYE